MYQGLRPILAPLMLKKAAPGDPFKSTSHCETLVTRDFQLNLPSGYEQRRGYQFEWLIHTRLDLIWAANHPPLTLMDEFLGDCF